jgi:hypothetical protein
MGNPNFRYGARATSLGSLIKFRGDTTELKKTSEALKRTSAALREIGGNRKALMLYVANKPNYMDELRNVWIEALYGPGAMTSWYQKTRPAFLKGIAGKPEAGVPVDTGALQDSLTTPDAEGAIHDVFISRDGKITFRYGAAPERKWNFDDSPSYVRGERGEEVSEDDGDTTYIDEINAWYSEGGVGFFEIGLEVMGKSARLTKARDQIGAILSRAAREFIAERVRR